MMPDLQITVFLLPQRKIALCSLFTPSDGRSAVNVTIKDLHVNSVVFVFHFGTENREEQLKKVPCRRNKRHIKKFKTRRLIKFKYRATLKVSFFLPSMWKFLAPPTMLRAKCGLGLWIEKKGTLKNY